VYLLAETMSEYRIVGNKIWDILKQTMIFTYVEENTRERWWLVYTSVSAVACVNHSQIRFWNQAVPYNEGTRGSRMHR